MSKALYEERLQRVNDAMALKEPDRVPISPIFMAFPFLNAGYTMAEVNYDVSKAKDAIRKYLNQFQPDLAFSFTNAFAGQFPIIDKVGSRLMTGAGQKGTIVKDRDNFQFVEEEYMKEDEYPEFLNDKTGWLLRKYLPRTYEIFKPFENLNLTPMIGHGGLGAGSLQFMNPELAKALTIMGEVGRDYLAYYGEVAAFDKEIEEMGFPIQIAAITLAAFDQLSDYLRGTIGTSYDIIEQPDNVLRAVEDFFPGSLYGALAQAKNSTGRFVFIPLHKGMDNFLSDAQYRKFYWDTLLRLVNGLIDFGLTPWIFTEGLYDSRVECLMDVPKGKTWIHFETADMKRVKRLLGDVACLSGGISAKMLMFGDKEEVIRKTKENIDILAPGGGYIFDVSEPMEDCKPELVEAMFDTVKTYGKYH
jgi:hypothetical protein